MSKQQSILHSGNTLMEHASHQFIASLLQMHPFLPCFRILEMDPVNISSLPTQIMSRFIGRGCWSDCGGGRGFLSWFPCIPLRLPLQRAARSSMWDTRWHSPHPTPSRFQWHSEGSFPENCASTLGVASCHLWCLPKPLHHSHSCALSRQARISAPG